MAALQKRTNLILGALGVLLAGALVAIALLFGRVADAQDDAADAQTELATARADLERVEAGAALYSSQIEGFQEKLVELRPQISAGVEEAITGLRTFGDSTIEFPVGDRRGDPDRHRGRDQSHRQVPIKTTIPINQSFDTTIQVDTPFGKIPLDVTVPGRRRRACRPHRRHPDQRDRADQGRDPGQARRARSRSTSARPSCKDLTDSIAAGLESLQDMLTGLT